MGCARCPSPRTVVAGCFSIVGVVLVAWLLASTTFIYLILLEQRSINDRLVRGVLAGLAPPVEAEAPKTIYLKVDDAEDFAMEESLAAKTTALTDVESAAIPSFEAGFLSRLQYAAAGCDPGWERVAVRLFIFFSDAAVDLDPSRPSRVATPRGMFLAAAADGLGDVMPAAADDAAEGLLILQSSTAMVKYSRVLINSKCVFTRFNATTGKREAPEAALELLREDNGVVRFEFLFAISDAAGGVGAREVDVVVSAASLG